MGILLAGGLLLAAAAREIEMPHEPMSLATPEARKLVENIDAGDIQASLKEAAKLVKRQPDNIELWHILGSLQAQMGEYDEALASLGKGLRGKGTDLPFLLTMARIHEDRARLGPGGARIGGMVRFQPTKTGQDETTFKSEQLRLAVGKVEQALQWQPEAKSYQAKHTALLLAAGDATAALEAARSYLKINPDNADLLLQAAKAAVALERWSEAQASAGQCVALRATEPEALEILGTLAARAGHADVAAAWFRKARFHAYIPEFLATPFSEENAARLAPLVRDGNLEDEEQFKVWRTGAMAAIDRLLAEKTDDSTRLLGVIAWHHDWHGPVEDRIYAELEARKAEAVLMALFDRANSFCTVGSCAPALARLGSETAFPLIIERLPGDRNMFSMRLPESLAIYGRAEAVAPLGKALKDAIAGSRRAQGNALNPMEGMGTGYFATRCIWALARFASPDARRVLEEVVGDKTYGIEATAALFLQTREAGYYQKLLKLLRKNPADAGDIADRFKDAGLPEAGAVAAIAEAAEKKKK